MQTLKLVVVLGLLSAGFAIGLAFAWSAVFGGAVTRDDITRHVLMSFVIVTTVVLVLRRRPSR